MGRGGLSLELAGMCPEAGVGAAVECPSLGPGFVPPPLSKVEPCEETLREVVTQTGDGQTQTRSPQSEQACPQAPPVESHPQGPPCLRDEGWRGTVWRSEARARGEHGVPLTRAGMGSL